MELPYEKKKPLNLKFLEYLVKLGKLNKKQLDTIKFEYTTNGRSDLHTIVANNYLTEKEYYRLRAKFYNIPFIEDIYSIKIDDKLLPILKNNIDNIKRDLVIPYKMDNAVLHIVMADPLDISIRNYWKLKFNALDAKIYSAVPGEIKAYIDVKLGNVIEDETIKDAVSGYIEEESSIESQNLQPTTEIGTDIKSNAPIAQIVKKILEYGANMGASDIHIEPTEYEIRVRYRIDGVLQEKMTFPKKLLKSIVTRIKIMAKMKIDESRLPQDGRIYQQFGNKKFDLRVSTLPTIYGEKTVIRLLERTKGLPKLEETGLRPPAYNKYLEALGLTTGIMLVTGPTGSGKTFTLAASIAKLNTPDVNIITIEDPVEIRIPGVTQVQVNHEIGLDFATVLRSVLRQDPDIIMVGEIRDKETAQLAVRAALTGHRVLSTLHTNDAASALPRLIDMGVESYLVASTVKVIIAQRLVRTICPYCKKAYIPDPNIFKEIYVTLSNIPNFNIFEYLDKLSKDPNRNRHQIGSKEYKLYPPVKPPIKENGQIKGIYLYKGEGCNKCNNTGYKGRTGIFEVLRMNDEIEKLVLQNAPAETIQEVAVKNGMYTLVQEGFIKVIEGITTIDEVLRVAKGE